MVSRARADVPKHSLQMLNQDPREASRTPNSCQKGPWAHPHAGGVCGVGWGGRVGRNLGGGIGEGKKAKKGN